VAVRTFVASGTYVPFDQRADQAPWTELTVEECWARRDTLYGQYGSFVSHFTRENGMDNFAPLWASIPPPPGTAIITPGVIVTVMLTRPPATPTPSPGLDPSGPDYEGVYGRSLDELEREWLGWLGTHDE
jgi:hypothetical protein